ncbi:unnamed protein product [Clonostachys rhizophaga]|uniref:Uncharacterized protein n=1 Tax=Clonostachys rhizophaga TaxID=160324 RepID=A0A9N9YHY8_9HYPO|nr:unnamed protein product [Clonostachys rhizophaga]
MAGPQLCYDDIVPLATTSAHQPAPSPHISDVLFLECSPGPAFGPLGVIVVITQVPFLGAHVHLRISK